MHMSRAPATSGGVVRCLLSHSLFSLFACDSSSCLCFLPTDAILQSFAPIAVGWSGFALGGITAHALDSSGCIASSKTLIHADNPADVLHYFRIHHSPKYKLVRLSDLLHCMESGCFLGQEILHRRSVRNDTQQHIHRPERYRKDTPARLSFQAHSAPLDYKFDSWFTTMYVTFHGSLDRLQSTGCKLFSVSFTKDSAGNYVLWLRQTAGMDTHRSGRILKAQIVVRLSASGPSRL
jgi:hypothetical protein